MKNLEKISKKHLATLSQEFNVFESKYQNCLNQNIVKRLQNSDQITNFLPESPLFIMELLEHDNV